VGSGACGDLGAKYGEPSGAEYGELSGAVLLGSFAEEGRLGDTAWRACVEDRRGCVGGYTDWAVRRECVGGLAVGAGAEGSTGVGDVYSGGTIDCGGTGGIGAGAEWRELDGTIPQRGIGIVSERVAGHVGAGAEEGTVGGGERAYPIRAAS
jgi:hypothetical protein